MKKVNYAGLPDHPGRSLHFSQVFKYVNVLGIWTKVLRLSGFLSPKSFPLKDMCLKCRSIYRLQVQDRCWVFWQVLWDSLSMLLRLPNTSALLSVLVSFILCSSTFFPIVKIIFSYQSVQFLMTFAFSLFSLLIIVNVQYCFALVRQKPYSIEDENHTSIKTM